MYGILRIIGGTQNGDKPKSTFPSVLEIVMAPQQPTARLDVRSRLNCC